MAKSLGLDQQLCFAIYSASHAFTRFYKPLLAPLGLTYPQYLVLLALWETDGLSLKAIGERLFLDSGTLTPLVKRMAALGLVVRARDAADERQVVISLTDKGRGLEAEVAAIPALIGEAARCSAQELNALRQQLAQLRIRLDAAA